MDLSLLGRLSAVGGVPSREERVRTTVREAIAGLVDDVHTDALGNLIAIRRAAAPANESRERIMIAAHMDAIGLLVRYVDDRGFLHVHNLGGFDVRNLVGRNVLVWTRDGDLPGILYPGIKPIHISTSDDLNRVLALKDFFVDVGLPTDEVKRRVRPGDPVVFVQEMRHVGQLVSGKDMDNRVSIFVVIETLKLLQQQRLSHDLYVVFTTQEEVGLRGAQVSAFGLAPTIGIAVDTTPAVDIPGISDGERVTQLGAGVGIQVMDSASISTRWLVDEFIALAERQAIPYQLGILPCGGTDASPIQRSRAGVPAITLSIPTRYMHTVVEACHIGDIQAAIELLAAFLILESYTANRL